MREGGGEEEVLKCGVKSGESKGGGTVKVERKIAIRSTVSSTKKRDTHLRLFTS